MKRVVVLIVALSLVQSAILNGQDRAGSLTTGKADAITVAAAPEIEDLAGMWIDGYLSNNPGKTVTLLPSFEYESADIRFYSATPADMAPEKEEWKVVVARDILVPVISMTNPFCETIMQRGLDPEEFRLMLTATGAITWGMITGNGSNVTVKVAIPADNAAVSALARFAGTDAGLITATTLTDPTRITTLLKENPGMIVFSRLAALTGEKGNVIPEGLGLIPIDVNANGLSDHFEQFYGDYDSFNRGVYIGKYPKELCSSIFCAASAQPASGTQADFVRWLLSGGQEFIASAGFTALPGGEGMIRREMLASEAELVPMTDHHRAGTGGWIWIAGVIAAATVIAYALYRITRSRLPENMIREEPVHVSSFNAGTVSAPAGILFGRSHTWAFMEKNGTLTLGIDDFLQHVTGTISRITLRSPGEKIRRGERLATIMQRGKQLDILSPVSGTITSRNEKLTDDTTILHSSPYAGGWVYGIEPENWLNESRLLASASKYKEQIREEFGKIRDFLASFTGANDLRLAHIVLQDGGELREGLLEEFGPEVWEEFQSRFLN